jgi:gamma-glutamyltranspeptidase/glutathione hydrolase
MQTIVVVACDHRGVLAAIHCTFDPDGVPVVPHEVTASKLACPVLRGVPRVRPGTPLGLPTPVALLTQRDVPWAAIGWEGMFVLPWDRLETQISLDLTVEQSLRALASETGNLRALVAVRGQRAGDEPRVYDLSPQSSGEPAWEEDVVEGETLSSR